MSCYSDQRAHLYYYSDNVAVLWPPQISIVVIIGDLGILNQT